jgi:hypothetical protein
MNQQELTGALAGGGRYRLTPYMLEVTDAAGTSIAQVDRNEITAVRRQGTTVTVKRRKGGDVVVQGADLDAAGRLEAALGGAAPTTPGASARRGGGIGTALKWGCGGAVALVVLLVVAMAVAGGGKKEGGPSAGSASPAGSGAAAGTNPGDVHVPLAVGASGEIAPEGNANKRSRVTILQIVDNAVSSNRFEQPQQGKKYWAVQVEHQNVGTAEVNSLVWKLRDSKDNEVDPKLVVGLGEMLDVVYSLTPGGKRTGWVVFEIDADAQPRWLRADPNPFLRNDLYFDAQ